jgi:hypothetical protein
MAMKQPGRKIYKSANGKNVDLDLLISRNELTPAVGNARVNARGDELGPGGKIIRKREDVLKDYYNSSPSMVDEKVKKHTSPAEPAVSGASAAEVAEWEEDEDGNFIRRGG